MPATENTKRENAKKEKQLPYRYPDNFSFKEMIRTSQKLSNVPSTWTEICNIAETASKLQQIRDVFGQPIKVNSGYRTLAVNKAVGGAKASAHMRGLAADITARKKSDNRRLLTIINELADDLKFDQVIIYMKGTGTIQWIHIGWREENPRGMLTYQSV